MEFIAISALCSVLIAHLLKMVIRSELRLSHVLMVNYFVATIAAAAQVSPQHGFVSPFVAYDMWAVALITGFIFIGTFYLYGYCVDINGVGLSLAAMRMSLAIPVFISVYFFNELLNLKGLIGFISVFIALLLMIPKANNKEKKQFIKFKFDKISAYQSGLFLFLLFMLTGFGDSSLKLFERYYTEIAREEMFMAIVFFGAFLMSIAVSWNIGKKWPNIYEILFGIFIGIPNLYSSIFVIRALSELDASKVFALVNVSIVVLGALTGRLIWKDQMQKRQLIGLGLGLIASFLLAYA